MRSVVPPNVPKFRDGPRISGAPRRRQSGKRERERSSGRQQPGGCLRDDRGLRDLRQSRPQGGWGAQMFGYRGWNLIRARARETRVQKIARHRAVVHRVPGSYFDSVRQCAADRGWFLRRTKTPSFRRLLCGATGSWSRRFSPSATVTIQRMSSCREGWADRHARCRDVSGRRWTTDARAESGGAVPRRLHRPLHRGWKAYPGSARRGPR